MERHVASFDAAHLTTLSPDRRRAYLRLLCTLTRCLDIDAPALGEGEAFRQFLARQLADGYSVATVRRNWSMAQTFFAWTHRAGHIDAEMLLSVRSVQAPQGSTREARPNPYRPSELRALQATLDLRWPTLPPGEANKWMDRFRDHRCPYSRVRSHVIRRQLDAVIGLALHLGLRRGEIYALDRVTAHSDNEEVLVYDDAAVSMDNCRLVPFTHGARAAMSAWIDCRYVIAREQRSLWLNLHAEPTICQPMTRPSFDRLLRTYVGRGWTLKRLRDTCAAGWVRAGLPLEHLRQLLGLSGIEPALPYARLVGGSLEGRMVELDEHFDELVGAVKIAG